MDRSLCVSTPILPSPRYQPSWPWPDVWQTSSVSFMILLYTLPCNKAQFLLTFQVISSLASHEVGSNTSAFYTSDRMQLLLILNSTLILSWKRFCKRFYSLSWYHNTSCFIAGFLLIITCNLECTNEIWGYIYITSDWSTRGEFLFNLDLNCF